jgi:hypothetical protein
MHKHHGLHAHRSIVVAGSTPSGLRPPSPSQGKDHLKKLGKLSAQLFSHTFYESDPPPAKGEVGFSTEGVVRGEQDVIGYQLTPVYLSESGTSA